MLLRFPLRKPVLFHNLQPRFTARQEDDLERLRRFHRCLIKCIIRQVHCSINFLLFPLNRDWRWLNLKRPYHIRQSQRQRVLSESRPRAYSPPRPEGEVVACIRVCHCSILS